MKKLFAILMTLALILALPLCVMAGELSETTAQETETEYEMNFGFYPDTLQTTLPIMGMGMLGIFLVTCIIVLTVVVLSKLGRKKEE